MSQTVTSEAWVLNHQGFNWFHYVKYQSEYCIRLSRNSFFGSWLVFNSYSILNRRNWWTENHWSQKPFCCQVYERCIECSLWTVCSCVECKFLCFIVWGALHFKVFTLIISGNISPTLFLFQWCHNFCVFAYDHNDMITDIWGGNVIVYLRKRKQTWADYTDYYIVILFYTWDDNKKFHYM